CATLPLSFYIYSLYRSPSFFFFNDAPTTVLYTLSLHDALPISADSSSSSRSCACCSMAIASTSSGECFSAQSENSSGDKNFPIRSEEHTSELQSHLNLVCRLLLEKKK